MRKRRKKNIFLVLAILICLAYFLLGEDWYLISNVVKMDTVETIIITHGKQQTTLDYKDETIDLVSYAGDVLEIDNIFEVLFYSYGDELVEANISIAYFKGGIKLGNAKVYYGNDRFPGYILYMNNVYWSTGNSLEALLDLLKEK